MTDAGAKLVKTELVVTKAYSSGLDLNRDWSALLQPRWTGRRVRFT